MHGYWMCACDTHSLTLTLTRTQTTLIRRLGYIILNEYFIYSYNFVYEYERLRLTIFVSGFHSI